MAEMGLYFGYGSNIWRDQMNRRCPENKYIGVGELKGWKWIINTRGYANIIPSPKDVVYGFFYELNRRDEERLNNFEGIEYDRKKIRVNLTIPKDSYVKGPIEHVLVYIDTQRLAEGKSVEEYVGRMNKAIEDGIKGGIPKEYFDKYLRRAIPPDP